MPYRIMHLKMSSALTAGTISFSVAFCATQVGCLHPLLNLCFVNSCLAALWLISDWLLN
jgi:hypothetical protein